MALTDDDVKKIADSVAHRLMTDRVTPSDENSLSVREVLRGVYRTVTGRDPRKDG